MSWLALLAITVMLVVVVVWSFVGSLPTTITATGVIVSNNTSTNTILSTHRGTVQGVVAIGTRIYQDDPVMEISTNNGTEMIKSNLLGTVSEVLVKPGDTIENGSEILRVTPAMTENQREVVVCYVPISDVDKVERGMPVNVSLTSADSNTYGHMVGRVINIDAWASSAKAISAVVGNDNGMVNQLSGDGKGICAVACELAVDSHTASGYQWSNQKGEKQKITAPQPCTVRIVIEEERPISKLFAKLKDIWENK